MTNFAYDVSIILPCYNDATHLKENTLRIIRILERTPYSFEIILIDDCSSDNSLAVIKETANSYNNLTFVSHKKNMGRGFTVREGLLMSKGRVAGFLDIDLEVDAHYVPQFVSFILDEKFDVVIGYRFYNIELSFECFLRNILSFIYRWIVQFFLKLPIKDTEAGYKFFNMESCRGIIERSHFSKWFWDTEIVAHAFDSGLKIKEVPAVFIRNASKKSTVKVFRDSFQYLVNIYQFLTEKNKKRFK